MDPNSAAPGAVPAITADKSAHNPEPITATADDTPIKAPQPVAPTPASVPPSSEPIKPELPGDRDATTADAHEAPKPVSVEDVPDKDGPAPAAAGSAVDAPPGAGDSAEKPAAAADQTDPASSEPAGQEDEAVRDKPASTNGTGTSAATENKDAEMTGALRDSNSDPAPSAAPPTATEASTDPAPESEDAISEPLGSGEREAAPQAIPAEEKSAGPDVGGTGAAKKRKADELEDGSKTAADTNGDAADADAVADGAKPSPNKKRKPGRPRGSGSGSGSGPGKTESMGQKVARKAKKIFSSPGKTERKTRSQGPA